MKRIMTFAVVAAVASLATGALAVTPNPNGAVLTTFIFHDCFGTDLVTNNSYPLTVSFNEDHLSCFGFANRHAWSFSEDGGVTAAVFNNDAMFHFCADLTLSGTGSGEAGLRISPWWSPDVDGMFNVRDTDGEIACFGGRLPFYSFSGAPHNLRYTKGTTIHLDATYLPNGLSAASPATIEYKVTYNGNTYSSGPLAFDEGNVAEGAIYGNWGMLQMGRVGGFVQNFLGAGNDVNHNVSFTNICYDAVATPVQATTWGGVKALYR